MAKKRYIPPDSLRARLVLSFAPLIKEFTDNIPAMMLKAAAQRLTPYQLLAAILTEKAIEVIGEGS